MINSWIQGFCTAVLVATLGANSVSARRNFYDIKADVNRLYTLENTQLQEQDNLAVAQGNVAFNLINVYRALGGGWEIRCEKESGGVVPTREHLEETPARHPMDEEVRDTGWPWRTKVQTKCWLLAGQRVGIA